MMRREKQRTALWGSVVAAAVGLPSALTLLVLLSDTKSAAENLAPWMPCASYGCVGSVVDGTVGQAIENLRAMLTGYQKANQAMFGDIKAKLTETQLLNLDNRLSILDWQESSATARKRNAQLILDANPRDPVALDALDHANNDLNKAAVMRGLTNCDIRSAKGLGCTNGD